MHTFQKSDRDRAKHKNPEDLRATGLPLTSVSSPAPQIFSLMWVALMETGIQGGPVHTFKALEDSGSSFRESGNC